jgi:ribulose kinase
MELDSKINIVSLKVDGGATKNNLMMQFQSDITNTSLQCPTIPEMTALGAAFASGLAVGFWNSLDELKNTWKMKSKWDSTITEEKRVLLRHNWSKAVARSLYWHDDKLEDPLLNYLPKTKTNNKDNEKVNCCKYSNCCTYIPLTITAILFGFGLGVMTKRFKK